MKLSRSIFLPAMCLLVSKGTAPVDALVDSLSLRSRTRSSSKSMTESLHVNDVVVGPTVPTTPDPLVAVAVASPDGDLAATLPMPEPRAVIAAKPSSMIRPSYVTWKRRLDTRQDPFDIHKWAGFGWWVSATAIFGTGTLSGFTSAPPVLEAYTYLFLLATLVQSVSSVPMVFKYRSGEPDVQRGFISSAIASSSSAVVGFWLSPFVNEAVLGPSVVASLVGIFVVADTLYSLTAMEDIKEMLQKLNGKEQGDIMPAKKISKKKNKKDSDNLSAKLSTVPWALPLNLILLHEMIYHGNDMRDYFVATIVSNGSSLDLVYYASLVTSIAISVGNLASTLRHRKLISKQVEDIAMVGSWVVTFVFNLKAAGMY